MITTLHLDIVVDVKYAKKYIEVVFSLLYTFYPSWIKICISFTHGGTVYGVVITKTQI